MSDSRMAPNNGGGGRQVAAALLISAVALIALFHQSGSGGPAEHASLMAAQAAAQQATAKRIADDDAKAAVDALSKIKNYQAAQWNPLHFKPAIDAATNEQCLACHSEILSHKVREKAPAGNTSAEAIAWYQTLDTYSGPQEEFHARHLTTPLAQKVMNLKCNFCHQGNDPREEAPHSNATTPAGNYTLRKMVNPTDTCLRCHGRFPGQNMGFDAQLWPEVREGIETAETPNGCLTCHAEQFRTVRHNVNYLNADAIETEAKKSADLCYGCHGGRAWYRISFPYPRHAWPGMDSAVPDWAKDRPTVSAAEHLVGLKAESAPQK